MFYFKARLSYSEQSTERRNMQQSAYFVGSFKLREFSQSLPLGGLRTYKPHVLPQSQPDEFDPSPYQTRVSHPHTLVPCHTWSRAVVTQLPLRSSFPLCLHLPFHLSLNNICFYFHFIFRLCWIPTVLYNGTAAFVVGHVKLYWLSHDDSSSCNYWLMLSNRTVTVASHCSQRNVIPFSWWDYTVLIDQSEYIFPFLYKQKYEQSQNVMKGNSLNYVLSPCSRMHLAMLTVA
jgi:hypothetical protein